MPGGDQTGPMGMGRMTGRGAGYCAAYSVPGYANAGSFGCGSSRGRGFRRIFYVTGLPEGARFGYPANAKVNGEVTEEREILDNQAEFLEKQLQQVKKRLSRLKEDDE